MEESQLVFAYAGIAEGATMSIRLALSDHLGYKPLKVKRCALCDVGVISSS